MPVSGAREGEWRVCALNVPPLFSVPVESDLRLSTWARHHDRVEGVESV
jgi:hypothetical protein